MATLKKIFIAALVATASALPSIPSLTSRQPSYHDLSTRQAKAAAASGLSDLDILQFALTLEHLEEAFYREGFAKFPDAAFGLDAPALADLKKIGRTEAAHVTLLTSALAQAGVKPVQPCVYDFGLTDTASMIATGAVLENVGVSAYLGAAPLLSSAAILSVAGSILTIEARHQTAIRLFSKQVSVTQPFDAPLDPRAVFSLAAPFIKSCPGGSNLAIQAFPSLTMTPGQDVNAVAVESSLKLASQAATGATHCAFTSGGVLPGGTKFTPFTEAGGCKVPQGVAGITYVSLTNKGPITGVLTDDITVAGPLVITLS